MYVLNIIEKKSSLGFWLTDEHFKHSFCKTTEILTHEQARLLQCFNASVSEAGCSFKRTLYCISFLCQSPLPVAVLCQTLMTSRFLRVAWRQACHEPRASPPAPEQPLSPYSLSIINLFWNCSWLLLSAFFQFSSFIIFYHSSPVYPPLFCFPPLFFCLPLLASNTPFSLPFPSASLLSLSVCPGQKRVCQTFPVQAADLDHTLRGDFCNCCHQHLVCKLDEILPALKKKIKQYTLT